MIYKITKNDFFNLLELWQTDIWYYNKNIINAAESIAFSKGFGVEYYKVIKNNNVIALFPLKYKKKIGLFKYAEYLISKDLGIDNIEFLIDWSKTDDSIFQLFQFHFSKIELHHFKIISEYKNSIYNVNSRKILFLNTNNYKEYYSKNFSQNIRTAKNRIQKIGEYKIIIHESSNTNFIQDFDTFTTHHFKHKKDSSWNYMFFKLFLNKGDIVNNKLNNKFLICEIQINDTSVGSIFGWINKGVFYFNQSFYNKDYAEFSPVVLIIDYFCEQAKTFDVNCFDFMRGTESYKTKFAKEFYTVCNLEITSNNFNLISKLKSNFIKMLKFRK